MFNVRFTGIPRVQEVPIEINSLGVDALAAADELWIEAQAKQPSVLSDGTIFNVIGLDGPTIRGHFVAYKVFFAQRRQPELFPSLRVRPLAVTGLSHCAGGIVFGRRSDHVAQDPGLWEFAPAGGVDSSSRGHDGVVDFGHQLAREFTEETGLPSELISEVRPWCVVEDSSSEVFDIVAHLFLNESAQEIERGLAVVHNDEYQEFKVVKGADIGNFLEAQLDQVAPLTQYLIRDLGLPAETWG